MKYPAIVLLAAEAINTIDQEIKVDAPNLIPPDHGTYNESYDDDDAGICQGDDLHIPFLLFSKHGNYAFDDKDSDDHVLQESSIHLDVQGSRI